MFAISQNSLYQGSLYGGLRVFKKGYFNFTMFPFLDDYETGEGLSKFFTVMRKYDMHQIKTIQNTFLSGNGLT